eukprot:CFRG3851T1
MSTEHSESARRYDVFNINTERVSGADYYGFLEKQTMTGYWYKFWFTLKGSQLCYYERRSLHHPRGAYVAVIDLFGSHVSVREDAGEANMKYILEIKDKLGRKHWLACVSEEVQHAWLVSLTEARMKVPPALHFSEFLKEDRTPSLPTNLHYSDFDVPDHLLLVLHGIGSDLDTFSKNVETFSAGMDTVKNTLYKDIPFKYKVVPCRWKEALKELEIFKLVQMCAPVTGGSSVRDFVQDRGLDIMYYMTERFQKFIDHEAVKDLNLKYEEFLKKYPDFKGDVSILAHSLGSVICLNTLTAQRRDDQTLLAAEGIHLKFEPVQLFMIGSPNAVFLAFSKYLLSQLNVPQSFRLYNIFHPYDPISYRIEPLLTPNVQLQDPYVVPHYRTMDQRTSTVKWIGSLLYRNSYNGAPYQGELPVSIKPKSPSSKPKQLGCDDHLVLTTRKTSDTALEPPPASSKASMAITAAAALKDSQFANGIADFLPKSMPGIVRTATSNTPLCSSQDTNRQTSSPRPSNGVTDAIHSSDTTVNSSTTTEADSHLTETEISLISTKPKSTKFTSSALDIKIPTINHSESRTNEKGGKAEKAYDTPTHENDNLSMSTLSIADMDVVHSDDSDGYGEIGEDVDVDALSDHQTAISTPDIRTTVESCPSTFRVDFVLQESGIEEVSTSAINALKAHSDYWTSLDTSFVVLSQMIKRRYPKQSDVPFLSATHYDDGRPRKKRVGKSKSSSFSQSGNEDLKSSPSET